MLTRLADTLIRWWHADILGPVHYHSEGEPCSDLCKPR